MKSKTNILYIFQDSSIAGGPYCLLRIIELLDKELFNPIILLKERGPLSIELEKLGVPVFYEKWVTAVPWNQSLFKISSLSLFYSMFYSVRKVKAWIKKIDADIVHLNTMLMYPYIWPAKKLGKKVIVHVREFWPKDKHQIQFNIAKRIIQKYSDRIITINESNAIMIGKTTKVHVVYDWIDFENRNKNINFSDLFGADFKSLKIFTFLGGTNWMKGGLEIVEAFENLPNSNDVRLLLVGSDKKEINIFGLTGAIKKVLAFFHYYRYSDKVINAAKRNNKIILMPKTNHIKSIIEQSYCLVSFFTVPHGNLPLAEACWLGKPSIAAETPEAKEYSNNGKASLLFKMNNKEEFKNKIVFALENEELIKKNAINGMSNVQKKFDPIRNSNLLMGIYRHLINETQISKT